MPRSATPAPPIAPGLFNFSQFGIGALTLGRAPFAGVAEVRIGKQSTLKLETGWRGLNVKPTPMLSLQAKIGGGRGHDVGVDEIMIYRDETRIGYEPASNPLIPPGFNGIVMGFHDNKFMFGRAIDGQYYEFPEKAELQSRVETRLKAENLPIGILGEPGLSIRLRRTQILNEEFEKLKAELGK